MSDENKGFFVALTNAGAALQTNAWQGGDKINLTEFNIGSDASGVNVTQIDVLSPVGGRMKINNIKQKDDDAGVLEVECVLPPEVGGWQMSSIGLFTDTGILFAVANIPSDYKPVPSEGATKEVVITLYIALGSTETVSLTIDPYKVIATQDWVNNDSVPAKHMADFNNPHKVTAAQVGAASTADLNNHSNNKSNPHKVTAAQVGAWAKNENKRTAYHFHNTGASQTHAVEHGPWIELGVHSTKTISPNFQVSRFYFLGSVYIRMGATSVIPCHASIEARVDGDLVAATSELCGDGIAGDTMWVGASLALAPVAGWGYYNKTGSSFTLSLEKKGKGNATIIFGKTDLMIFEVEL